MNKIFKFVIIVVALIFFGATVFSYADIVKTGDNILCQIGKVDDGDTFDLNCWEKHYPNVRLLWVNTPDKNQDEIGYKHCYYNEAKEYIEKQKNKIFQVSFYGSDLCKDSYKGCRNLVRLVDHASWSDLGRTMIMRWYAFSWTRFSMIPYEIKKVYQESELISKESEVWLWRSCNITINPDSPKDSWIPDKMTE